MSVWIRRSIEPGVAASAVHGRRLEPRRHSLDHCNPDAVAVLLQAVRFRRRRWGAGGNRDRSGDRRALAVGRSSTVPRSPGGQRGEGRSGEGEREAAGGELCCRCGPADQKH